MAWRKRGLPVVWGVAALVLCGVARGQVRAFPEAVGFGGFATGGRAGAVYHVSNLNNSGIGSFRDAVSQPNRIVVFDVGGYINLSSEVHISSNTTILGQTAPGMGIGLTGAEVSIGASNNVIVRYLRVRPGSASSSTANGINLYQASNIILDHVSVEFAKWNNVDAVDATNITVQNSIIADPIGQQFGGHTEGGGLFTWVGNLWANAHNRQPLAKANTQFINNIVYNYQAAYTSANTAGFNSHDIIGNYFIVGPATTSSGNSWYQLTVRDSIYSSGNLRDTTKNGVLDGSATSPSGVTALASPWNLNTPNLPALSATAAYAFVNANAGASLVRDDVDSVIVGEVQSLGTSGPYPLPGSQTITGLPNNGFGSLTGGALPADADGDFLPDAWETSHGLNPNSPNPMDDPLKLDPVGYRFIEKYANELSDTFVESTWTSSIGLWTTGFAFWDNGVPNQWTDVRIRGTGATNGIISNSFGGAYALHLSIGGNGPAAGERVVVSSGAVNVYGITTVGDQNNGKLEVNGGLFNSPVIVLGNTVFGGGGSTTFTGSIELNGGSVITSRIVLGGGSPGSWKSGGSIALNGGLLQITPKPIVNDPNTVSSINELSIDSADAMLDLTNNALRIDYVAVSPQDQIRQWLWSGANTGFGIVSSLTDSTHCLGYLDDGDVIRIQFVLAGDANFDGVVNELDQAAMFAHWNAPGNWSGGDFDYNGVVDQQDLEILKVNFPAAVPEPQACALMAAIISLLTRRQWRVRVAGYRPGSLPGPRE